MQMKAVPSGDERQPEAPALPEDDPTNARQLHACSSIAAEA
jgi:hypothetical protein